MHQFPTDADGNYVWQLDAEDGTWFFASNYVRAWKSPDRNNVFSSNNAAPTLAKA
jgi:hypothetical protein